MQAKKVILIMTDSQRWDMVNCYRDTGLRTPCLDRMAEQGIRFERAYDVQPVCQAARAAIFTGQNPHSVSGWTNSMGLTDNCHTLGERLSDKGVHSAYIGKWHLDGGDYFGLGRAPRGWDPAYWYDMRNYLDEFDESFRRISRDARQLDKRTFKVEDLYANRCSNRALDFLSKHADESFFLTVSYDEPHDPYLCPPEYYAMYQDFSFPKDPSVFDTLENKPELQRIWGKNAPDPHTVSMRSPAYFACNSYVDTEIGRVLDAAAQYAPDAVVIYTSDHGGMLHAHRLGGKGPVAYDEITRIPLLMCGPGLEAGRVDPSPVSHLNLAPTIMELMGFQPPKVFEGKSLLAQLEDPAQRVNEQVFMEFGRYEVDHDGFGGFQPMRATFDGRYKLTLNLMDTDELYDLAADPYELTNLIEDPAHNTVRDHLHDAILWNMNATRDPFRGYQWARRSWRKDAPEASWDNDFMTRQREDEEYEARQLDYMTGMDMEVATRRKGEVR